MIQSLITVKRTSVIFSRNRKQGFPTSKYLKMGQRFTRIVPFIRRCVPCLVFNEDETEESCRSKFSQESGYGTDIDRDNVQIDHYDEICLVRSTQTREQRLTFLISELNGACEKFGRGSQEVLEHCDRICKEIKKSTEIIDTWASYCEEDLNATGKISVVFIVIKKQWSLIPEVNNVNYHFRQENQVSSENDILLKRELSDPPHKLQNENETIAKLRDSINCHADKLYGQHSNISVIMPSLQKSQGYGSPHHTIADEPCIAIYVPVKGYIPIQEDPFPKTIDGFKTDVIEGKFESFTGRANDFHEHIKHGVAIHANVRDSFNQVFGGTLGGFVDHQNYGLCGITCAHVLYSHEELDKLNRQGRVMVCTDRREVFQPLSDASKSFGRVVMVFCNDGDNTTSGMEVALFDIHRRQPKDGSFPVSLNETEAGFDDKHPLSYNSGKVCETSALKLRTEVYKFGIQTGITRGSFALQGAAVRREPMVGQAHSFRYNLKNQIVILQIGDKSFAGEGDSGALVLIEGTDHDSIAIGLVQGGMAGRVFVTPICDVLRAFGCSDIKMHRFSCVLSSQDSGCIMDSS